MKKRVFALIACLVISILCSGCGFWTDGSYSSKIPHKEQNLLPEQNIPAPETYHALEALLQEMIVSGVQKQVISVAAFGQQWQEYMEQAEMYLRQDDPVGAYALKDITYELGTSGGVPALAVEMTYYHSRAEILNIRQVEGMDDATKLVEEAVRNMEAGIVLWVRNFESVDFDQLVRDFGMRNPRYVMEVPRANADLYPETGRDRVVEITFTYVTARDALIQMQEQVDPIFVSAQMYVSGEGDAQEKYGLLYAFLMNRYSYTVQTSITPAYSLLRHGVGDSRAFATVFASMCELAGLECTVISGTRDGAAWHWNRIEIDGVFYHVDLLRCKEEGGFAYRSSDSIKGYVWDFSAYP